LKKVVTIGKGSIIAKRTRFLVKYMYINEYFSIIICIILNKMIAVLYD
jgi:hypothetical protein